MNSRERVYHTVRFEGADRIPRDLWTLPGIKWKHGSRLESLLERYPLDIVNAGQKVTSWDPDIQYQVGKYTDPWGTGWQNAYAGIIGIPVNCPLSDFSRFDSYRPPLQMLEEGWEAVAGARRANPDKFIGGGGLNLFERMQWLRGLEELMMDIAQDSPNVYRLRDMVLDYNLRWIRRAVQHDNDAIGFADDWGGQTRLLIRPDAFRRIFVPAYREMFQEVKRAGKMVFFHSDGYIIEIIEDLIEAGVDALNSQVWCMGVETLAERFAGRLCFWGELDRQSLLPRGTPGEIQQAAQMMMKHLARPNGGLIGQGEAGVDVPLENIEAMLSAWGEES